MPPKGEAEDPPMVIKLLLTVKHLYLFTLDLPNKSEQAGVARQGRN